MSVSRFCVTVSVCVCLFRCAARSSRLCINQFQPAYVCYVISLFMLLHWQRCRRWGILHGAHAIDGRHMRSPPESSGAHLLQNNSSSSSSSAHKLVDRSTTIVSCCHRGCRGKLGAWAAELSSPPPHGHGRMHVPARKKTCDSAKSSRHREPKTETETKTDTTIANQSAHHKTTSGRLRAAMQCNATDAAQSSKSRDAGTRAPRARKSACCQD